MVHVPADTSVTVAILTLHTDCVRDEKLTGKAEAALALHATGTAPNVRPLAAAGGIVCAPHATANDASLKARSPISVEPALLTPRPP